jgi:hypothetical protein
MTHIRRNKAVYGNLDVKTLTLNRVPITEAGLVTSSLTGAETTQRNGFVQTVESIITDMVVDVEGTTGDGFATLSLFTLPATRVAIIGAFADFEVVGIGAGNEIDADAEVIMSIGSTATTDGTLATTDANVIASTAMTLVGGKKASTEAVFAGTATLNIDAAGGAGIHFNIGVPDADISADGTLTLTAKIRVLYVDISTGD